MVEERKIFQKCERCGNWFDPEGPQCPYCPPVPNQPAPTPPPAQPQRKSSRPWGIAFGVLVAVSVVALFWMGGLITVPAPFAAPKSSAVPTVAVGPTPTLRPLCVDRRDELSAELTALLISLTNSDLNVKEVNFALDDDHDGDQIIRIKFQAYKPGTGKYPNGQLYVDVDDATCEIVSYEIFW